MEHIIKHCTYRGLPQLEVVQDYVCSSLLLCSTGILKCLYDEAVEEE